MGPHRGLSGYRSRGSVHRAGWLPAFRSGAGGPSRARIGARRAHGGYRSLEQRYFADVMFWRFARFNGPSGPSSSNRGLREASSRRHPGLCRDHGRRAGHRKCGHRKYRSASLRSSRRAVCPHVRVQPVRARSASHVGRGDWRCRVDAPHRGRVGTGSRGSFVHNPGARSRCCRAQAPTEVRTIVSGLVGSAGASAARVGRDVPPGAGRHHRPQLRSAPTALPAGPPGARRCPSVEP